MIFVRLSFFQTSTYIRFFARPTDDQQHTDNPMDSSGLMHLIVANRDTALNDHTNDESVVGTMQSNDAPHDDEAIAQAHIDNTQLPLATTDTMPVDGEQPSGSTDTSQTTKSQYNFDEIHREMIKLIPIPTAWPHTRHQSNLFSYPDLPHFNVIRQATFREGRFVCPFCQVDFASKEGIRYHLYNSCSKSPYPKAFFRCLLCSSELADRSSLRTHLARHVSYHERNKNKNLTNVFLSRRAAKTDQLFLRIKSMYLASQRYRAPKRQA